LRENRSDDSSPPSVRTTHSWSSSISNVLLDTLVHEINTVRGVLGEPARLDFVDMRKGSLAVILNYGATSAAIHWVDVPGMTRYSMEFMMFGSSQRATL
jgi:hypothetical protein